MHAESFSRTGPGNKGAKGRWSTWIQSWDAFELKFKSMSILSDFWAPEHPQTHFQPPSCFNSDFYGSMLLVEASESLWWISRTSHLPRRWLVFFHQRFLVPKAQQLWRLRPSCSHLSTHQSNVGGSSWYGHSLSGSTLWLLQGRESFCWLSTIPTGCRIDGYGWWFAI